MRRALALVVLLLCVPLSYAQSPIFSDVPDGTAFKAEIERFYNAGYTQGCASSPLQYCPADAVSRSQAAVFLGREKLGVQAIPGSYPTPFVDISSHLFAAWISTAYTEGVVESTVNYDYEVVFACTHATNYFCPDAPLTRSEMAKFLLLAKYGRTYVPPDATGVFTDLPASDPRAKWAEKLLADGITSGCATGPKYCPGAAVTRTQIAVFFTRAFNMPPSVSITGITSTGGTPGTLTTYTINAAATDPDDTLNRIELYANATRICPALTGTPVSCAWTATRSGSVEFKAVAFDSRGKSRFATSSVVVANQGPTVTLTSPLASGIFTAPATFALAANAGDIDGGIGRVEFWANNVLVASDSTSPFAYSWANLAAGAYDVFARAYDVDGAFAVTPTIRIAVANAPTIAILTPTSGQVFAPGASVVINSDPVTDRGRGRGVDRVDYSLRNSAGTVVLSRSMPGCNPPPGQSCPQLDPWKTTWVSPTSSNQYTLTSTVVDTAGSTASATLSFIVSLPPTVSLTTNKAIYAAPASVQLTATATDPDGGTVQSVAFKANGVSIGTGVKNGNLFTLTWSTSQLGTHSLTATATDNFGASTTSTAVPIEVIPAGPQVVYYHNDLTGSPLAATNANGTVLWNESYAPYGERWAPVSNAQNALWFAGKPTEDSSGLSYFGGRWYNPRVGRFYSVDPQRFADTNPHSFNRYAYANNNPYRFVDPEGHSPIDVGFLLWDLGKLGIAIYDGAGVSGALTDVAISVVGVASPIPGTGVAIKAARAADKVAEAVKAADNMRDVAKSADTLAPGPFARESIPAHRGPPNASEQRQTNELMRRNGCHTCGTKDPGTKSGNAIADHQPPQALGEPKVFLPHCNHCKARQGGQVLQEMRRQSKESH
jgi:RHS repeat-associated protein